MGDALACALIERRQFKATDFAQYHPGGSLGKRLLSRVKDYMVSSNLPVVGPSDMVSETIIQISKTKQGIAIVLDGGEFVGVVTDGDVRRAMQSCRERFFSLSVSEIMSRNPKTIGTEARLTEAADRMKEYNIHTLVVVDEGGAVVGLIDLFHCM